MDNDLQTNNGLHYKITAFLETHAVIYQFLRFACIGFLNTGLAFLVQNILSKFFDISKSSQSWEFSAIQGVSFVCAVIQSYPWNRTWTFGGEVGIGMWKNFVRLVSVGALGASALVFVVIAASLSAPWWSYLIFLVAYLITEEVLWKQFGFHISNWDHVGHSFLIFFIVTGIGFLINAGLSGVLFKHIHITNSDLDKNIAAALATGITLFWNFVGYKVIVFKK